MSGPKGVSVSVFSQDLREIFQLQSAIQSVFANICNMGVCDNQRNIKFGCTGFTSSNQRKIKDLLSAFTIQQSGIISQELYERYKGEIRNKISKLKTFLTAIETEKKSFLAKQEDYNSFVSYEEYFQHTIVSFDAFRANTVHYLESYIEKDYPELFKETKQAIEKITISIGQAGFEYGFRNKKADKKNEIDCNIRDCEAGINQIRIKASDHIIDDQTRKNLEKRSKNKLSGLITNKKISDQIKEKINIIESFITEVDDGFCREKYKEKLEKLLQSQTFKDLYYYTELLEDIKEAEKIIKWKEEVHKSIVELNQMNIHAQCKDLKNKLLKDAIKLTDKMIIKAYEIDDFKVKLKTLKDQNEKLILDDLMKEKERQFIKAQLVQSLENLGYEVMNDMQVVDFEKESDFLFNIPEQANYLNLRFRPDGSFLYNFLIPEKRSDLSMDQKQQKLAEMETTCNSFKTLINELSVLGLKTEITNEKIPSEKCLIQVPPKHRGLIRAEEAKKVNTNHAEKRKYLDR